MGNSHLTCRLEIKAVPNAQRSEIVGCVGGTLKVKVHAPPEDGKANAELCSFLARRLGLHRNAVRLGRGASSRVKVVEINSVTMDQIEELLPPRG